MNVLGGHRHFLGVVRDRYGILTALRNYPAFLFRRHGIMRYRAGTAPAVYLRPGTTDLVVHDEVFLEPSYGVTLPEAPAFIIDAGAHVGLTSVYFAHAYPDAVIAAVEPEPGNFAVLQQNARAYPNIHPINAGLWWRAANLRVTNPGANTWSFQFEETANGSVPAVSVPDILERFQMPRVSLLKMDIEGAEVEVLSHASEWMPLVDNMVIETHDHFRPGCSDALETALAGQPFIRQKLTNTILLTKPRLR